MRCLEQQRLFTVGVLPTCLVVRVVQRDRQPVLTNVPQQRFEAQVLSQVLQVRERGSVAVSRVSLLVFKSAGAVDATNIVGCDCSFVLSKG